MNRLYALFLGPEILWLFFYLIVLILIRLTKSPNPDMDSFWVNTAFIVPLVLIPLTFMIYFIPGVSHSWLLLRIWIVGLVGAHFVLSKSLGVHSEGGPGVGTAYIMGMGIVFVMLIAGSIFALIKFR
jgi:hypothetical protein